MSGYRLTARADRSLRQIFLYTINYFGEAQADQYRKALFSRLDELAAGRAPHGRPLSALVSKINRGDLFYAKAGSHFIIYQPAQDGFHVVDFVHERRDLAGLIEEYRGRDLN